MRPLMYSLLLLVTASVHAQPCQPHWARTGQPVETRAFLVGSDVVAVPIVVLNGVFQAHRRVGIEWEPLPPLAYPSGSSARFTLVLDDGAGPKLCYFGRISGPNGGTRWSYRLEPSGWVQMPSTFYTPSWKPIGHADLGGGSTVFGKRGSEGGQNDAIGKWNGTDWEELGVTNDTFNVQSLFSYRGAVYFPNIFQVNGIPITSYIAKWDGSTWSDAWPGVVFSSMSQPHYAWLDTGQGPQLYATGIHTGPPSTEPVLSRFDGQQWHTVAYATPQGGGSTGPVDLLAAFDDGYGPKLYISGIFPGFPGAVGAAVRYDGNVFSPMVGINALHTMLPVDDPRGPAVLIAGGYPPSFTVGGGVATASALLVGCPNCYANCDLSEALPRLNIADFGCFIQKFASLDPYANCTMDWVIDIADFQCFLQRFAAGCP